MPTIKVTIVARYEPEPEAYSGDPTLAEMAAFDQQSLDDAEVGIQDVLEWCNDRDIFVTFEAD